MLILLFVIIIFILRLILFALDRLKTITAVFVGPPLSPQIVNKLMGQPCRDRLAVFCCEGQHGVDRALQVAEASRRDIKRLDPGASPQDRADPLSVVGERAPVPAVWPGLLVFTT